MAYFIIPQTGTAPPLMHFPLARRYLMAGYKLRRNTWTGYDGEHELAWVSYRGGLYLYHNGDGTRVVRATDVGAKDLRATDWTMLVPSCAATVLSDCACAVGSALGALPGYPVYDDTPPPEFDLTSPNADMGLFGCALPPANWQIRVTDDCSCAGTDTGGDSGITCPDGTHLEGGTCVPDDPGVCPDCPDDPLDCPDCKPSGPGTGRGTGGATGTGGAAGTDGGGGDPGTDVGGAGGGGGGGTGGGGGGGGPAGRRPRPTPSPTIAVTMSQVNSDCLGSGCEGGKNIAQEFAVAVDFTVDDAGLWFYRFTCRGKTRSGTCANGDAIAFNITVTGPPGADVTGTLSAWKPGRNGGSGSGSGRGRIRSCCCAEGSHWNSLTQQCEVCPDPTDRWCEPTRQCLPACLEGFAHNPTTCACDECPAEGSVLSSGCNGGTFEQEVADGNCGSNFSESCPDALCVDPCGSNASWDCDTKSCACDPGYHDEGGECVADTPP